VTSRTVLFPDGSRKTLGIILPGQYEFSTEDKEQMEVLAGELRVKLPENDSFESFGAGQTFEIPRHSTFLVQTDQVSDYCCSYIRN
jgi:uncharacterized protein YaiE (UPF0345 family)